MNRMHRRGTSPDGSGHRTQSYVNREQQPPKALPQRGPDIHVGKGAQARKNTAMPQALSKVYTHIIFSTKHRKPVIDKPIESGPFDYLDGLCGISIWLMKPYSIHLQQLSQVTASARFGAILFQRLLIHRTASHASAFVPLGHSVGLWVNEKLYVCFWKMRIPFP
jgi:hypothetical protein